MFCKEKYGMFFAIPYNIHAGQRKKELAKKSSLWCSCCMDYLRYIPNPLLVEQEELVIFRTSKDKNLVRFVTWFCSNFVIVCTITSWFLCANNHKQKQKPCTKKYKRYRHSSGGEEIPSGSSASKARVEVRR